jgi:hypothetical protein
LIRFAPFRAIEELVVGTAHCRFVSLQLGPRSIDVLTLPEGAHLDAPLDIGHRIEDTAALVCALDLVITVDTMVAHLAAALGKPVWLMLSPQPCWRWRRDGDTSLWYPTMRIWRQGTTSEWSSLATKLQAALTAVALGTFS